MLVSVRLGIAIAFTAVTLVKSTIDLGGYHGSTFHCLGLLIHRVLWAGGPDFGGWQQSQVMACQNGRLPILTINRVTPFF